MNGIIIPDSIHCYDFIARKLPHFEYDDPQASEIPVRNLLKFVKSV
jgi:hypothetical protein